MIELDTFGRYVRDRLDEWGREFSLARDCDYLGHQSKNMLQVLIEHKGEMPGRAQGYKPLEVSLTALQIEQIVEEIARDQARIACALRSHYCGSGRRKVERYKDGIALMCWFETGHRVPQPIIDLRSPKSLRLMLQSSRNVMLPTERGYLDMVKEGNTLVRGALIGIAQAA